MIRSSIRPDRVQTSDIEEFNLVYSCEDCAHFDTIQIQCTLGLNCLNHLKSTQDQKYKISGEMLFCRFIEIE